MPSREEKEGKPEVIWAKVEEMRGPGRSEHHPKGFSRILPPSKGLRPLHPRLPSPSPLPPPPSRHQIKSAPAAGSNNSSSV